MGNTRMNMAFRFFTLSSLAHFHDHECVLLFSKLYLFIPKTNKQKWTRTEEHGGEFQTTIGNWRNFVRNSADCLTPLILPNRPDSRWRSATVLTESSGIVPAQGASGRLGPVLSCCPDVNGSWNSTLARWTVLFTSWISIEFKWTKIQCRPWGPALPNPGVLK